MKNLIRNINGFFYDMKYYFSNLIKYHKIVKEMRPWDGHYIYMMTKFQLEQLLPVIENGHEEDESRLEKVKDIKRLIYLLNNSIKDNYSERCGFDHNYNITFEKLNDDSQLYEMKSDETPEQESNNRRAIEEANQLEKDEIEEIGKLYTKVTYWWD
jgi:hypothetical protein